jgi:hypothetical protein
MMTRLVVLTGAPVPRSLDWSENTLADEAGLQDNVMNARTASPTYANARSAQWRQVPMEAAAPDDSVRSKDSQNFVDPGIAIFLTTAELTQQSHTVETSYITSTNTSTGSMHTAAETLDDFYDQSLAQHEDLTTSQLSEFQSQATSSDEPSWGDEKTQPPLLSTGKNERTPLPFPGLARHLDELRGIPSAAFIRSIQPQTKTVNLVVGIMVIYPPQTVTVGRWSGRERTMQLMEMLVGDDTRAGFHISVWLPNSSVCDQGSACRGTLEAQAGKIRIRDIVLLGNVALRTYQGKVHGQSLPRNLTTVELLYRRNMDDSDTGGIYTSRALLGSAGDDAVLTKVKQVRQWLIDFVGVDFGDDAGAGQALLPPDTQ